MQVAYNYNCMVASQPNSYTTAQPYYMPVTQAGSQDLVEHVTTTAHAQMLNCNGAVYTEAGHVVYEDGVVENAGEHDEYINMTMNKLFNGECELEKMECGDEPEGLPSINSLLLTEAAM